MTSRTIEVDALRALMLASLLRRAGAGDFSLPTCLASVVVEPDVGMLVVPVAGIGAVSAYIFRLPNQVREWRHTAGNGLDESQQRENAAEAFRRLVAVHRAGVRDEEGDEVPLAAGEARRDSPRCH
jgi:hypothetical protein